MDVGFKHLIPDAKGGYSVLETTGLEDIRVTISRRRHSLFGNVRRLPEDAPAHAALKLEGDSVLTQKTTTQHLVAPARSGLRLTGTAAVAVCNKSYGLGGSTSPLTDHRKW